jgi:hypothetical protein
LRGTGESIETTFDVEFALASSGSVERAAVAIDETQLALLSEARLRA